LVKLPCQPNVITILEAFVKHLAAKLLCASPPRNSKNGKQLMPDDVQNKLNLCKETMDGIRVYFDFTLPHLLLYRQEKKQYYTDGTACSPLVDSTSHSRDSVVSTTMPVIKQRDTNEDCAKTSAFTENKLAEDANTSFIEEKSVKDRRPPKQGIKRVNGVLVPTKATQLKKRKKTTSLTIKEMFLRVSNSNNAK
ncbi:hypothetical protein AVEN_108467-1, partial [Araneus ventricosus]